MKTQDWSDVATSQGTPGTAGTTRNQKRQERVLQRQREYGSDSTWMSDPGTPELEENTFVLFSAASFLVLCHGSPGK